MTTSECEPDYEYTCEYMRLWVVYFGWDKIRFIKKLFWSYKLWKTFTLLFDFLLLKCDDFLTHSTLTMYAEFN